MGNTYGNHTGLGFDHDSLNLLNSVKVILGKLKCCFKHVRKTLKDIILAWLEKVQCMQSY